MHEFCPLCSERGFRRRIKALQINLHEAVWACEGDECEWPFGYEDFIYVPREAGNTWSCYWDNFKPSLQAINESLPVSTELSLYTPPETPAEAVTKDCSLDVQCSDNNATTNDVNNSTVASEGQSMNIADIFDHDTYGLTNNTSEKANIKTENLILNNNDNSCTKSVQAISNIENISKDVLTETEELEHGRIILTSKDNTCISKNNLNKDVSIIKNTHKSQDDTKTSDLKDQGNNLTEKSTPSNLKITTVEIDGLPPVILSYEAPTSLPIPTTVSNKSTHLSTTQCVTTSQSTNINAFTTTSGGTHKLVTMISKQSSAKIIPASKQYAKFSFSAIKKKIQETNDSNSLSSDNKCLSGSNKESRSNEESGSNKGASHTKDIDQIQKDDSFKTIASCSSIDTNKAVKIEVKSEKAASENVIMDSSLNIDTLLDDFIKDESLYRKTDEENILSDLDDDWINSLLH